MVKKMKVGHSATPYTKKSQSGDANQKDPSLESSTSPRTGKYTMEEKDDAEEGIRNVLEANHSNRTEAVDQQQKDAETEKKQMGTMAPISANKIAFIATIIMKEC